MNQNSKTTKMVLGQNYRVLNSRLALTRLAIVNTKWFGEWRGTAQLTVYP